MLIFVGSFRHAAIIMNTGVSFDSIIINLSEDPVKEKKYLLHLLIIYFGGQGVAYILSTVLFQYVFKRRLGLTFISLMSLNMIMIIF